MRLIRLLGALFLLCSTLSVIGTHAQNLQTPSSSYVSPDVPNTVAGLQTQVDELIRIGKTHDQATWSIAIATFALPNPDVWFQSNFAPTYLPQLAQDYPKMKEGHLGHISWVLGHYVDSPGFAIHVEKSEMPPPPGDVGFESLIPRPLSDVSLQNFRLTPAASSGTVAPSWVSSFVFESGHFRVIGGTFPFWDEKLSPFRGPMSLPPATVRGMTVQGLAFQHDQKGGPITEVVQLKITVEHDGRVSKIKVISGDKEFVEDAKKYIKASQFPPLPDIPQLANVETIWDFEVAFFSPKT